MAVISRPKGAVVVVISERYRADGGARYQAPPRAPPENISHPPVCGNYAPFATLAGDGPYGWRVGDFDAEAAALAVATGLRAAGTPERAAQEKRYLKSDLEFFGVTVPQMRRVVLAAWRVRPELSRAESVAWAVALWDEPVHERRMAAVEILTLAAPRLGTADLAVVERLVRSSGTWALVDGLAVNVAGEIALRDTDAWPVVDGWAIDADFWVRRSALLSLLRRIRAGRPDLALGAAGDLAARSVVGGGVHRAPRRRNVGRDVPGGRPAAAGRGGGAPAAAALSLSQMP